MFRLIAEGTQVTTNPNAWDSWLGRVYTLIPILTGIAIGVRFIVKKFHASVAEIVELKAAAMKTGVELVIDQRVTRVEEALKLHTDQEASIVRAEITQALAPISAAQNQLLGSVSALTSSRDTFIRYYDEKIDKIAARVTDLARPTSTDGTRNERL